MFRLSSLDAREISKYISNDFEKVIVFLDLDNLLFSFYYDTIYTDINTFFETIRTTLHEVALSVYNFKRSLDYILTQQHMRESTIILFTNFGPPTAIKKLLPKYKEHRQIVKVIPSTELIRFLATKENITNIDVNQIRYISKRYLYRTMQQLVNKLFRNVAMVISRNMDSDYIPYLIYKRYGKPKNQYWIFSADKDFIQMLVHKNVCLYSRRNVKQEDDLLGSLTKVQTRILIASRLSKQQINDLEHPVLHPIYLAITGDNSDKIQSLKRRLGIKNVVDILNINKDRIIDAYTTNSISKLIETVAEIFNITKETDLELLRANMIATSFLGHDSLYQEIDKVYILNQLKHLGTGHLVTDNLLPVIEAEIRSVI